MCQRAHIQIPNIKTFHSARRTLSVESSENICHVIAGVGEDYGTAGVLVPVGDVVDFVVVDYPGVFGGGVLFDLLPGVLCFCGCGGGGGGGGEGLDFLVEDEIEVEGFGGCWRGLRCV